MTDTALHPMLTQRNIAAAALIVGVATILGAYGFQYIGGYQPCELCYAQRLPYYWALPVLAVLVLGWQRIPRSVRLIATLLALAIFAWGAWMGGFHAGVEWGWWPGPTSCTGPGLGTDFSGLSDLNQTKIVPCDVAQWRFLGISFAGYNGLISALIVVLCGASAFRQFRNIGR
ncbi:MAG TPA: disulfide bond formation protein B [Devosiaceae bacterium]